MFKKVTKSIKTESGVHDLTVEFLKSFQGFHAMIKTESTRCWDCFNYSIPIMDETDEAEINTALINMEKMFIDFHRPKKRMERTWNKNGWHENNE